jgi:hypothetical protein
VEAVRAVAQRRLYVACVLSVLFLGIWAYGLYDSWDRIVRVFGPGGNTARLPF